MSIFPHAKVFILALGISNAGLFFSGELNAQQVLLEGSGWKDLSERLPDQFRDLVPEKSQELPLPNLIPDCPSTISDYRERISLVYENERSEWIDAEGNLRARRPTTTEMCWLRADIAGLNCMSDSEWEACRIEALDRMELRVVNRLLNISRLYQDYDVRLNDYLVRVHTAEASQCDADFEGFPIFGVTYLGLDLQFGEIEELVKLYENDRFLNLQNRLLEAKSVLGIKETIISSSQIELEITVDTGRVDLSDAVSWEKTSGFYPNYGDEIIVFQTLPDIPTPKRTEVALQSVTHPEVSWTVKAGSLAGPRTKAFYGEFSPPEGFKYCSHSIHVISAIRVCRNSLGTGPAGVSVSAQVRSKPGTKARGWFNFQVKVTGISESATGCQRAKSGCLDYTTSQPIPPDASPSSCDRIEAAEATGAMLCGKQCFQGISWCQYGEPVSGRCRPVGSPEPCGHCIDTDF